MICLFIGILNEGFTQNLGVTKAVWTVNYVKANEGQLEDLMQFYHQNWAAARKFAKRKKYIVDYQWFVLPENDPYQLVLMTKYKDKAQFDQREANFQRVFEKVKPVLINGKSSSDMRVIVKSEEFYEPEF